MDPLQQTRKRETYINVFVFVLKERGNLFKDIAISF